MASNRYEPTPDGGPNQTWHQTGKEIEKGENHQVDRFRGSEEMHLQTSIFISIVMTSQETPSPIAQ